MNSQSVTIVNEDNKLDFLPWVVTTSGDELIPMLYSVWKTGQWDDQNLAETMYFSELISKFASPRWKKSGPGDVQIDYDDPTKQVEVPIGTEFEELKPPVVDEDFAAYADRVGTRVSKSTISNVIQTGDIPSQTAFATYDLVTKGGVKPITPYKELAQDHLEGIYRTMLNWVDHDNAEILAYPKSRESLDGQAEPITITKDDFDPEKLYMDVELTEDVPTDRLQRMNAAVLGNRELKLSRRQAKEQIGVTDVGADDNQWYAEQKRDAEEEVKIMQMQAAAQREQELETQRQMFLLQMQQQQQLQGQQQQLAGPQGQPQGQPQGLPPGGGPEQQGLRRSGVPFQNASGLGFDPNQGGIPPALVAPAATREAQARNRATSEIDTQQRGGF